ncbi:MULTISPECIES: hypothetical protein [Aeromicrobium]|uniref:hypothetical protein n=1 Tax=Aeromicrobium TaxID=2040 RepID=UPI0006F3F7DD|nr:MULTISPECIES: hypothetical protein [Aeromicrobium]KQX74793.1 hypothetical protein ASD10_06170 [Aeromicrobium sp. Root472D3]MBD8607252.1 hypothetical protein [Aeromicrobium sp. CFBP 8757]MCL8251904.1 DUF4352 domain-containing protein [Aeromicrobium fastidiosum]
MSKTIRRSLVAATAAALLAVSACGGSDSSGDEAATTPETSATTPAAPETTDAPDAQQAELPVDQTIQDDVLGDTVKITGMVRDFQAPSRTNIPDGGGEWVLLELDTAAGDKFSGGIQGGFTLYQTDDELAGSTTGIIDDDMTAAGFTPWETASAGERTTGWVAFQVNTRADAYQLQYKRLAASVIGGGDPIPEKIWTIELPAS